MYQPNVSELAATKNRSHEVAVDDANPPKRRTWTSLQKLRVLKDLEEIKANGTDVGAFLIRNALFSSTVSLRRQQSNAKQLVAAGGVWFGISKTLN